MVDLPGHSYIENVKKYVAVSKGNNSFELVLNAGLNKSGVKERIQGVEHSYERKYFDHANTYLTKLGKL